MYNAIVFGASYSDVLCATGNTVVKIVLVDNVSHEYIFFCIFDSSTGEFIKTSADIGFVYN